MQGLQASKPPKWHNFDFPAGRMIEVRNSSQPRDAASGILTHPSAFLTRYPRPHYPIPSTRLRYVILHPMLLPYTPELDPIPQAMVMRVVIAARLDFTQHCPTSPESDEEHLLVLPWRFITPQPEAGCSRCEECRRVSTGRESDLAEAPRYGAITYLRVH